MSLYSPTALFRERKRLRMEAGGAQAASGPSLPTRLPSGSGGFPPPGCEAVLGLLE